MFVGKNESMSLYQKWIVSILTLIQFTLILDFMIMSPLGALMIPDLNITASQFGILVSAYAFSAGLSGFFSASIADQYDRKRMLLFFYVGFLAGTFFCGVAQNYEQLLMARILTGIFGGVIGSIVFAMVADLFPYEKRGRVMGFLQMAFSASQILGLPLGLAISNIWGWKAPFWILALGGVGILLLIIYKIHPFKDHLKAPRESSAFMHLWSTATHKDYMMAFVVTALLSLGGYMIMPFASAYSVNNLKISTEELPWVYFISGLFSIVTGPLVGKFSDEFGKMKIFIFGTLLSSMMVLLYTHLGPTPLIVVIAVNVLMFLGIFSRMIPSQAMISALPDPQHRGAFMSLSSSMQQMAGGVGSLIAGALVHQSPDGTILHFERVGYLVVFFSVLTWVLMTNIHKTIHMKST